MVDFLIRAAVVLLYPLLLAARVWSVLTATNPLRLREPKGSTWIERPPSSSPRFYFSEGDASRPGLSTRAALAVARLFASSSRRRAQAEADIPDEIYTLW